MGLFNKKKETNMVQDNNKLNIDFEGQEFSTNRTGRGFMEGSRTIKDLFSPASIIVKNDSTLKVGNRFVRNYVMQGYPSYAQIKWLDHLYNFNGSMDTFIYIEPSDSKKAIDELTAKITQFSAQLATESEKGHTRNLTNLQLKIESLEREKLKIEANYESLFKVAIFANLSAPTEEELENAATVFEDKCKAKRMVFIPTSLRMLSGFKSALPTMDLKYKDKLRNFNTGGVVSCFPFYDGELSHKDGVFIGRNLSTKAPVILDVFDKKSVNNTNMAFFGCTGSGKSYSLSLFMLRSLMKGVRHGIIDADGEYVRLTKQMGGINIEVSTKSNSFINFFEIDEEDVLDENNFPTGEKIVSIADKVADLSKLIAVMAKNLTDEQLANVETLLSDMYQKVYKITEDPKSLYEQGQAFNEVTGHIYLNGKRKKMPTFSDFHNYMIKRVESEPRYISLIPVINQLAVYRKEGAYGLFDCQTTVDMNQLKNAPIINFDVSKLESGKLRPIGMYIAMTFLWEKFVKQQPNIKKRIVADEAWMLISPTIEGSQFTANYLETYARRIRKRNAGLLVASQHVDEFEASSHGMAVIKSSAVQIFLRQTPGDIKALRRSFELTDGELGYITNIKDPGYALIKSKAAGSTKVRFTPFEFEDKMIGLKVKKDPQSTSGTSIN